MGEKKEEEAVDGNRVETEMTVNSSHLLLNMAFSVHRKDVCINLYGFYTI